MDGLVSGPPSWGDLVLTAGVLGGAITWAENRLGLRKKYKQLEKKVSEAEAEVLKSQKAVDTAMTEKNNEINLIREDRDQWRERAVYWQDQAQHMEIMLNQQRGDRS